MRIPVYDSKISGVSAGPRLNSFVEGQSNTFAEIADGLNTYANYRAQQIKEETDLEYYKADTAIRYELEEAQSKLIENIKNGGRYAGAEEQYQKNYDSIIEKYGAVFSGDPIQSERVMVDYKKIGLGHTLQLRDVISSRRKSDARQAYSLRRQQAESVFLDDPQKAIEILTGATAGLKAVGAVSDDGAKAEIAQFVKENTANRIQYFAQNNPNDPKALYDMVEAEKKNMDTDTYLRLRGHALGEIEKKDIVSGAFQNIASSGGSSTQKDVDIVFGAALESGISVGSNEYAAALTEIAIRSDKIPSQVQSQLSSVFSLPPDDISVEQAKSVSDIAAIAKSLPSTAISRLPGATQASIRFVNDSVEAGIPVHTAVKQASQALASLNDPDKYEKDFSSFKDKTLYKDGDDPFESYADGTALSRLIETSGTSLLPGRQGSIPDPRMRSLFENRAFIYSRMGRGKDEAIKAAYDDVSKLYQPYKQKMIKYAPIVTTGLGDSEFEQNAVIGPLKRNGLFNEKYNYEIVSDSQTEEEFLSGKPATYPVYVINEMGVLDRVRNKDNKPIRTMPLKRAGYKHLEQQTFGGSYSFMSLP